MGECMLCALYLSKAVVLNFQLFGLQPTSLLCSWDYSGSNTGVGYHFLLQRNLSNPGMEPTSLALAGRFFTAMPPGKPLVLNIHLKKKKFPLPAPHKQESDWGLNSCPLAVEVQNRNHWTTREVPHL